MVKDFKKWKRTFLRLQKNLLSSIILNTSFVSIFFLLFITVIITSCGGGKKAGSPPASGNTILPSAPKLTPPTIVQPPATSFPSNDSQLNIAGTCTPGPGAKVYLGGDENKTTECTSNGDFNFQVSASSDGTYSYTLHMESLTQHPSDEIPLTWMKSSLLPSAPTITSPGSQPYWSSGSSITITGNCVTGGTVNLTGDSTQTTTCDTAGNYTFTDTKSIDGVYLYQLSQVDSYGNSSTSMDFTWTRNTMVPATPTITSPAANPYISSDSIITVVGTCVGGNTIRINKVVNATEQLVGTTSCNNAAFTVDIEESVDATYNYTFLSQSITSVSSSAASFQWVRNTVVPPTPILSSPATTPIFTNTNSISIVGSCDDGNTVYLTGDATDSITCSSSSFNFSVTKNSDATYNFSVYQHTGSLQSGAASVTWTRDTLAPIAPIITAPGINPYYSASNNLLISGVCENGSNVALSGDSSGMVLCSASSFSFNISKNTNSTYTFSINQTDAAGNSSSSTSLTWTLDTVAPNAPTITTPATYPTISNGNSITIAGACENNAKVYLTDASTQNVTCAASAYSFTVNKSNDGTYDFSVYQTDLAGSNSSSTVARWIRDTVAPSAPTIANPATSPYMSSDTTLTISGTCESGSTISYSNATTGTTTCSSSTYSFTVTKNIDATYTVVVAQTDAAGNVSGNTTLTWTRNTSIPSSPVVTTPNTNPYYGKVANLTLSGTCNSGNSIQLTGASSQSTTCSADSFSFNLTQSTDGTYNYSLVQVNGSSISSGITSFTWTLDRVSPSNPAVTAPTLGSAYNSASSLTISGTCEANATIQYSGSASGTSSCSAGGTFSFAVTSSVDGVFTYSINQIDLAGNASGSTSVTWNRDTLSPSAPSITQPNMNPFTSGDTNLTLAGGCEPNATVNLSGASAQSMTCTSLSTYSFTLTKTTDATYNYSLSQTDLASNSSSTQSFQWTRDTSIPFTPIITSPTTANYHSNGSTLSISVTCQTGLTPSPAIVSLSGVIEAEVVSPLNSLVQDCNSSPVTFIVQKNTDGLYQFTFSQENPNNGNSSASTILNWTRDTIAPNAPSVTSPSLTPYTGPGNIILAGDCEPSATVNVSGDAIQSQSCSGGGLYSFAINKSSDATYTFNIIQTDLAGNISSSTAQTWIRNSDSLPPPTITSPATSPYSSNTSNLTISGGCQPDYTVTLGGNIIASEVTSPLNSLTQTCTADGNYSFTFNKASDGTFNINLTETYNSAISAATNFVWTKDTVAPTATITTTAANPNLGTSITFTFSANQTSTFQCKLNSGAYQSCNASTSFSGLTNGSNTVYVKATDAVGNISTEVSYTWTQAAYNTVALYHMAAGTGTALDDSGFFTSMAAFNNNLTATGSPTTNTSGKLPTSTPKSFTLGTGKYFSLTSNNAIQSMNQTMTIEGLFNFSSSIATTGNYYTLFSKNGASGNYGWELRLRKSTSTKYVLDFVGSLNGTTMVTRSSSSFTISTNTWYHVYVTWNLGTINFYFGSSGATTPRSSGVIGTAGSSVLYSSTANFKIGANTTSATSGTSRWLNGSVDEVRLSNIIRSSSTSPSFPASEYTAD